MIVVAEKPDPFVWLAPEHAGDASAYSAYARKIRKRLIAFFTGNRCEDAENLASECLFRLTKRLGAGKLGEFDSESARKAYLLGIARNVLREWRQRPESADVPLADDDGHPQFQVPPLDLVREECLKLYREAVERHAAQFRQIEPELLTMLDPTHGRLAELARARGIKPATMRKQAERLRDRFMELLTDFERYDDLKRCLGIDWD
jgi:DNA-directed RNA polymerase specialized sigma24 family protein